MTTEIVIAANCKAEIIALIYNDSGKLNPRSSKVEWWDKKQKSHLYHHVMEKTAFLPVDSTYAERIHCFVNDYTGRPSCKMCENNVSYNKMKRQYFEYCSKACVDTDGQNLYHKKKKTEIERYGRVCDFSGSEHKKIAESVCLEKYGHRNATSSDEVKQKIKDAHRAKYGTHYTKTAEYAEKRTSTCVARYGTEHWMQLDRYKQFFSDHNGNKKVTHDVLAEVYERYSDGEAKQHIADDLGISRSHMHKVVKKVGLVSDLPQNKINYSNNFVSNGEKQLRAIIQDVFGDYEIQYNVRNLIWPEEIDIVVPELKLMFEYNGTYWHSDVFKSKHNHVDKLNKVERLGYHLFTIFENVFNDKRDVVISKIKNLRNRQIYCARNTRIVACDYSDVSTFLETNHVQGGRKTAHNYKVIDKENNTVAVATFKKFRDGVELVRFASNIRIPGVLNKVLRKIDENTVYSFADRCFTNRYNNVYLNAGFKEIAVTAPGYFYVKGKQTISRHQAMKHKLRKILASVDNEVTEYQNMMNSGFHRVWDCGNLLYQFDKQSES